jgi:hypothetical protein
MSLSPSHDFDRRDPECIICFYLKVVIKLSTNLYYKVNYETGGCMMCIKQVPRYINFRRQMDREFGIAY